MTAATGIKRLGIAVVAAFVAGAIALGVVSLLIPANTARDAVRAEIKAATGFDPVLGGPVTVSFFPTGAVSFGDVVLFGPGRAAPALVANRLIARLRTLPLLAGRIEISDIVLDQPQINVDIDAEGNSNWTPLLDSLARALADNANRAGRGAAFSQIHVGKGMMMVRDAIHDVTETLAGIDLALAWPAGAKAFSADGSFQWRDEKVDASLTLGDLLAALTGKVTSLKLKLAGAPMKIAFDGAMSNKPSLKIDGTLAIDAPSLRDAMRWTGNVPPPGGGFGRFALKAKTNVVGSNLAMSGVNLELDGNAAEGVLSYASTGRRTWQGTLAVDALDLTPYVSTVRLVTSNNRDWDRMPITLDGLSGFDLDLRLSAAKVTIGDAKLGRTAVAANLRGGRLALTIGESQAYKGVITGSVTLAKAEAGAEFKAQVLFANVDLDAALAQLFGIKRLEGKGQLAFAVEAHGGSVMAMTRTLNGTAKVTGGPGAISGVNIEQLLRRLERRPLSGSGDFRSGRTPYDRLSVVLAIAQGAVTAEHISLEGPTVRLGMVGSASIPTRELDFKGTASLVAPAADGTPAFELPFIVQGSWNDPIMLPDAQSLIQRSGATAPLLDALRNRKTRDAVRSALDKLTGAPPVAPAREPAAEGTPTGGE